MTEQSVIAVCNSCDGTGLYAGVCERDKAAVICSRCKGTGASIVKYTPFEKRKITDKIDRVFAASCGYVHSARNATDRKTEKTILFADAGCTYEEWLGGKLPRPVKELYCPYQWTGQDIQLEKHDGHILYQKRCSPNLRGYIRECHNFQSKDKCWKTYDLLMRDSGKDENHRE